LAGRPEETIEKARHRLGDNIKMGLNIHKKADCTRELLFNFALEYARGRSRKTR
jgi:hypothetical protein